MPNGDRSTASRRLRLAVSGLLAAAAAACGDSTGARGPEPPPVTAPDGRIEWLRTSAVAMESITPSSTGTADLEALARSIGDARVVLLGEQTHGDGSTFLAKTRVLQYLHQTRGFDVVLLEGPLYDIHRAAQQIAAGSPAAPAAAQGIPGIWSRSRQFAPFLQYLEQNARGPRPIELAGFDYRMGTLARGSFGPDLAAFLRQVDAPVLASRHWPGFLAVVDGLAAQAYRNAPPPDSVQAAFRETLQAASGSAAGARHPEAGFWRQNLENLGAFAEAMWLGDLRQPSLAGFNRRDGQMARNALWYIQQRYPDRKVIVWADTEHVVRGVQGITDPGDPGRYTGLAPMGQYLWDALGTSSYAIAFTPYDGALSVGFTGPDYVITPASEGSLEWLLEQARFPFAFLDLRTPRAGGEWLRQPFAAHLMGGPRATAAWSRVVDGVFYIRTMEPSRAVTD